MTKRLLLAAALLVSFSLHAELKVELTLDRAEAVTGERVGFRLRVTNTAAVPVEAHVVIDTVDALPIQLQFNSVPDDWECSARGPCRAAALPAGSGAELGGFVITPTAVTPRFGVMATADGSDGTNDTKSVLLPVAAAARAADLTVSTEPETVQVPRGTEVRYTVMIRNAGPDDAQNVTAWLQLHGFPPNRFRFSGAGWTCEGYVCTRPSLAAGQSAPIDVLLVAPANDAFMQLSAQVYALANVDANGAGGTLATIYVGEREAWRMRLLPLPLTPVQGANGALWKTEMTMLLRSDGQVRIEPDGCEPEMNAVQCPFTRQPPPGRAFDPIHAGWPATFHGEHFLYVPADEFDDVRVNARVYDASRFTQTAGAEVPTPRDDEFAGGTITLLGIPVEPQYRHTLRIYDDAGRDGARVLIRIYADDENEPRTTMTQTLRSKDPAIQISTARLPLYPALAQLTLDQLLPLAGIESLRVEIRPLEPGVRIWSFVSITNNDTHHITTVTPQ